MSHPQTIRDELDLGIAIRDVATEGQTDVVVVLTTPRGQLRPYFDAEALARTLGEGCRVIVVPGHLTKGLNDRLGAELAVHSGAARVFPVRKPSEAYIAPVITANKDRTVQERVILREARLAMGSRAEGSTTPDAGSDSGTRRSGATLIHSPNQARELAAYLLSQERRRPVMLVTRRAGEDLPLVDLDRILADVGDLVETYEMGTGDVSWAFAHGLAAFPGTECYGGAGRVYPVGLDWTTNLHRSPLRFVWNESQALRSTDALISDALAASLQTSYSSEVRALPERTVAGTVTGTISGRGLVSLSGGATATIWPELTAPRVEADQLVLPGMSIEGSLDERSGRLDVSASLVSARDALAHYREGDLITARVVAVERELAILEIFPGVQAAVPADQIVTGRFVIDVSQWLSEDEVVAARVSQVGTNDDDWDLTLLDIDPDIAPLAAPALLPGGPPWLPQVASWDTPPPDAEPIPEERPTAPPEQPLPEPVSPRALEALPAPTPLAAADESTSDALRVMTAERDALARDVERMLAAGSVKDADLKQLRTRAREREQALVKVQKQLSLAEKKLAQVDDLFRVQDQDRTAFLDAEDQFRYEVELEWARRIPAAEKTHVSRMSYTLGPDFLPSLSDLDTRDREKALQVVLEVVLGRVHESAGRQTHQLRTGSGGSDPYVTRPDGATCWRAALQVNTPQARRMHFWMLADGSVEFASVRQHDDMRV